MQRQLIGWAAGVGVPAIGVGLVGMVIVEALVGSVPGIAAGGHAGPFGAVVVALAMLLLTVVATSVPARRVVAIDPTESLRDD